MCPPRASAYNRVVVTEPLQPPDPEELLRRHFGYPRFRPGQRELVEAALVGADAFGVLPTGGGKSVCYQVPALVLTGLTVVVSPLVSLMADQVRRAREVGLRAETLHSGLSPDQTRATERALRSGRVQLLLLAPERFASRRFQTLLPTLRASLLAVDEAHCISMWGHDFRPVYRQLGKARALLGTPVMALTATATPRVRRDIETSLGMRSPVRVVGSFDRPNLLWAVRRVREGVEKDRAVRGLLPKVGGARLVYAATRARVERIRTSLARHGVRAEAYHAGLPPEERTRVQEYFLSDRGPVVVATNAFGMGIDRPDVRLVVHDQLPGSIEDYYQEAGRAGRDGAPALCVALYARNDRRVHRSFLDRTHPPLTPFRRSKPSTEGAPVRGAAYRLERRRVVKRKLRAIVRYASSSACRRRTMLRWFGEEPRPGPCGGCDRCAGWRCLLERIRLR